MQQSAFRKGFTQGFLSFGNTFNFSRSGFSKKTITQLTLPPDVKDLLALQQDMKKALNPIIVEVQRQQRTNEALKQIIQEALRQQRTNETLKQIIQEAQK